jgi:type VI secretion system protein ImpH
MTAEQPNRLDTDFKAAAIAAAMIEQGAAPASQVMILPAGPDKRAYGKDIAGITAYSSIYRDRRMTLIRINREGLYDMLPEGLFHRPPASSIMMDEEDMVKDIKDRRESEKQARTFFAPLEAELYHLRTIIELYENRLDKKGEYDELVNIFFKEWAEFRCFTNKQMLILMHVLPVIHERRNDLPFITGVLDIMFGVTFNLEYKLTSAARSTREAPQQPTRLDGNVLGVNFVVGNIDEPEEELLITMGPLTAQQMLDFLPGTRHSEALSVLLGYFVPMQSGTRTQFVIGPEYQKVVLGSTSENSCLGFTTFLGS